MKQDEPEANDDIPPPNENGVPPAPPPSGYGRPPVNHQFKKGASGNPRGRPRKVTRSLTPRQLRRDVISILESDTKVRTEKGVQKVTVVEAIFLRCVSKALSGHGPSIRYLLDTHADTIREHYEVHEKEFSSLECAERIVTINPKEETEWLRALILEMRKATHRN